jgi:thiamine pyrophosphokinase
VRLEPSASQAPRGPAAVVFLAGSYEDVDYYTAWAAKADLVVAADGAAAFLVAQGIRPDVVIGDFDSLPGATLARLVGDGVEIVRHPVCKNETDGELAVAEALRRGAGEVLLAGALGALDHTLGHLAILRRLAASGVAARLVSPQLTVRVFEAPAESHLDAAPPTRVSLVALGDALVTLEGLDYPLVRQTLPWDTCLGLGNAVTSSLPSVVVHEGTVAVLVASGEEAFGMLSAGLTAG